MMVLRQGELINSILVAHIFYKNINVMHIQSIKKGVYDILVIIITGPRI